MTEIELTNIIRYTLQTGLGSEFRCIISLPWQHLDWQPFSKHCVLIFDGRGATRPCGRVYYDPEDDTLNFDIIELDNSNGPRFRVPLAQPDAFEQVEARIKCEEP